MNAALLRTDMASITALHKWFVFANNGARAIRTSGSLLAALRVLRDV